MLHIEVSPAPAAAATAQATARRILSGVRVQYLPSGQVARRLHMSSRTLGKITGQLMWTVTLTIPWVVTCVTHACTACDTAAATAAAGVCSGSDCLRSTGQVNAAVLTHAIA